MSSPRRTETPGLGKRVVGLFRPYRGRVAVIAIAIVFASTLGIAIPFLTEAVFDNALFVPGGPDLPLLYVLVGAMIGVTIVSAAIGVWQTYHATVLGNMVMRDLRDRLFAHLQSMQLGFFTSTKTGAIQSRLGNDVGGVQSVVTDTASTILSNVVTVAASLIGMLLLSWRLTLVALALMPVFILLQIRVGRVRRRIAASTQASLSDMSAITQEALSVSGVLLAKVFNRESLEIARYREENARQAKLQVRQTMTGQSFFALVQAFFGITPAAVYLVAGLAIGGVLGGGAGLSAGTIVAFTTLQTRLLFPVVQLLRVAVDVQTSLALFARIFEYLDLKPTIVDAPGAVDIPKAAVKGDIRFDGVWFRYPAPVVTGSDADVRAVDEADASPTWALQDITLHIRPGQLAAVVGPSGAGKTTLSYLVPRLYDVDRGSVQVDDHDVHSLRLSSLANLVGMVTQETYLFHGTIRDNLRYADEDATDAQIEAAARAANIHDRIVSFDDGYDTVVGERGYRLSGGEKQRLAIARVVLKDPRILILDEAT
ncbi:MAG TPA: ABC transporter ATP-binding protein, partial [Actinomycetes bacterium]|nr:ABC transporter ATP-binding protein [Actinomycetes bacterium]